MVTPLDTVIYYIAPGTPAVKDGTAGPALWRIVSSFNSAQPEELVPGVERMELKYGVDTDGDTIVDEYDDADAVNTAGNWNNVVSVRVAILVRSLQANSPELDKKIYTLLDSTAGPFNDHYERSLYTTTVALRNRTT
jgi:type IV pilus assembly protein PilW